MFYGHLKEISYELLNEKGFRQSEILAYDFSDKCEPQCQMEDRVLNIFRKQNNIRWPVALLLTFLGLMLKSILSLSEKLILQESLDLIN